MNLQELIDGNKLFNEVNKTMITDIIDSGITIVYGIAGVGKTYSTIKHLNKYDIEPVLIDFDGNDREMKSLNYIKINGEYFINNYDKNIGLDNALEVKYKIKDKLKEIIYNNALETNENDNEAKQIVDNIIDDMDKCIEYCEKYNLLSEDGINSILDNEADINGYSNQDIEIISNKTILIDTYQSAMFLFKNDIDDFKSFLNILLKHGNNIVLIAHSKTLGNNEVVDMNEIFANHCDAKIRLTRTQTKTKDESFCLFVEKLRGYTGNTKIENWER